MFAGQRQSLILSMVNECGSLSVSEIQRRLQVSRETIRRDLNELADRNVLRKAHGGVLSLGLTEIERTEPVLAEREVANVEAKRAIGRLAVSLVPDGASVVLSSGSTPQCVADALLARRGLTVFCNSLGVATRLANRNGNRVHMLGGEIQANNNSTLGADSVAMLSNYHVDFAFVGAGAIAADGWIMDYTREEADLHRLMLRTAGAAVVVADYSKFNRFAPVRVDTFEKVTHLVTDHRPDGGLAQVLAPHPLEVLLTAEGSA
ncbi:MAG TPA: DeoR/GlpR family DNA-binding transcription regulator [Vineibacter sp.]|nr:DeoR/GlpR family DNA-binding transcription regulator [Vineibacter sp.]